MARDILMPQMGYDMTQGTIVRWVKKVGDKVHKGDIVAEIETDKATVEIEAFDSGTLLRIIAQPGQTIPIGQPIATIGEAGEKLAEVSPTMPIPSAPPARARAPKPAPPRVPAKAPSPAPARAAGPPASPLARRLAAEAGVDLATVQGTGPGGRIVREDVEAAAAVRQGPPSPAGAAQPATAGSPAAIPEGAQEVEPSRLRQTVARRMAESKRNAPHFYVSIDIRMGKAMQVREELAGQNVKVSVNDLLLRAVALAVLEHREVNAAYVEEKVRRFSRVDIGVAVATEKGLLSPALLDVASKPVKQIAAEARDLVERARAGKLKPDEYGGGTITLSNLGMFGIDEFLAIINPPQALIISVGAATDRVIAVAGNPVIEKVMTVWAAADHRVLDGAEVARFLATLRQILENPQKLRS